jgi:hypothetical protein
MVLMQRGTSFHLVHPPSAYEVRCDALLIIQLHHILHVSAAIFTMTRFCHVYSTLLPRVFSPLEISTELCLSTAVY